VAILPTPHGGAAGDQITARDSAPQQFAALFDHLVGAGEQIWWNRSERLRGFQVDEERLCESSYDIVDRYPHV
jgi:hypothetical protein